MNLSKNIPLILRDRAKTNQISSATIYQIPCCFYKLPPTADKDNIEVKYFYDQLLNVIKPSKNHDMNVILGDFNAKVGSAKVPSVAGPFGLGRKNKSGELLIQFCKENKFVIKDTCYKMSPQRLCTWKSPQDTATNPVRNQIDYKILMNKRFQNSITRTAAYPGADHNPVIAKCLIKFKTTRKAIVNRRINIKQLKDV